MTRTIDRRRPQRLPRTFDGLAAELAPQAIADDAHHARMVEMIDRLMAAGRLLRGQRVYLETLVQLVEAYEATHDAIDIGAVSGRDALAHLLEAHRTGVALVAVLGWEQAEHRVGQAHSLARTRKYPLTFTIEPE